MISFISRINRPFLDALDHPITIPGEHHYRLRTDGAVTRSDRTGTKHAAIVVLPDGRRFAGHIFYGEAGGHFFYQIRTSTEGTIPLRLYFQKEPMAHVFIIRTQYETLIYLLDAASHANIEKFTGFPGPQGDARVAEELEKMTEKLSRFA